jgi:hypothetical protein
VTATDLPFGYKKLFLGSITATAVGIEQTAKITAAATTTITMVIMAGFIPLFIP